MQEIVLFIESIIIKNFYNQLPSTQNFQRTEKLLDVPLIIFCISSETKQFYLTINMSLKATNGKSCKN